MNETRMRVQEGYAIIERTRALAEKFLRLHAELREAFDERHFSCNTILNAHHSSAALAETDELAGEDLRRPAPVCAPSIDVEMLEDPEMMAALNACGFDCDKCGGDEPLVAVARFVDRPLALGICGDCYREMKEMSRGEVV